MESQTYTAQVTKAPQGGYVASVPSLHGIAAYGASLEDAVELLRERVRRYLELLIMTGEPIPEDSQPSLSMRLDVQFSVPAIT